MVVQAIQDQIMVDTDPSPDPHRITRVLNTDLTTAQLPQHPWTAVTMPADSPLMSSTNRVHLVIKGL